MAKQKQSFLTIDVHRLDQEWIRQPELYGEWAKKLADARLRLDECKNALELAKAEIEMDIRSDPDEYDLAKVTEATVAATIVIQTRYKDAQEDVEQAQHKVNVYAAVINGLEHKKRALENLVRLQGQDYFSEPVAQDEDMDRAVKRHTRSKGRRRKHEDDDE